MRRFRDRNDAGRRLAADLAFRVVLGGGATVVLGLPRGGVPVAEPVARELGAPLDVIMVRKLGVPQQPELAMGAIAEGGVRVVDESIMRHFAVTQQQLAAVERREQETMARRAGLFRAGREPRDLSGRTAVIVDDGLATGATARVACRAARQLGAERVVLAVPVAAADTVARLRSEGEVDEVVALSTPRDFGAVGRHYADFTAVEDDDVVEILRRNR